MDARLAKLERIRARSQDPYPPRYQRTHTTVQALGQYRELEAARANDPDLPSPTISVAGRLGEDRYRSYDDFDLGDFVGAKGTLFRTRTGEITLEVEDFVMLAKALRP